MGKILSISIGSIVTLIGLVLLLGTWRWEFFMILKGTLPVLLVLGGVIAVLSGISELRDTLKSKKE